MNVLVELFEIADTFQTKLFVDDVFCWRDDYVIYDDVNHFVWTKPNQKDYNYLDRPWHIITFICGFKIQILKWNLLRDILMTSK